MRLIDADVLLQRAIPHGWSTPLWVSDIAIDDAPTIDAAPVIHGRWIKNDGRSGWHCSCCGKDDLYAYPYTENNERELQDFYCPNCGAKMDEPTQTQHVQSVGSVGCVEEG